MNNLAEEISNVLYPEKWIECTFGGGFRHDNNASCRSVAGDVLIRIIEALRSESSAEAVMLAFYRREHGREPTKEESLILTAKMSVALMALDSIFLSMGEIEIT